MYQNVLAHYPCIKCHYNKTEISLDLLPDSVLEEI